ncbi:TPA: class I SAM-dependent methyltransferase [Candidatus Kaiserbacteria bacterium]|nr:MAG: hypothetical protein UY93_C0002G0049 [Parcubacteria group bacterium GW2011_GWA1_56_13]KKW45512.1 MAG: hypothetical protein UY97_C0020G0009 [Parcubacteria group bacterium GW2011_GWB1_57_6]HCR52265.1 class I SAM-dependent methyltransferase [Candidatus Kaiserbacteria bacterium]
MHTPEHSGTRVVTVDGSDVIECTGCGFKHVMPLPTPEVLKTFYEDEFYQEERKDYFKEVEEDKDWWMLTYNHYYDLLEKHTKGRKLLDIGSGPGLFLECGNARGWQTLGFEPSPRAGEYARSLGCEVVTDFFTAEQAKRYGPFDAITLNFVLEHVPNPTELIAQARSLLAPGGVLLVVSPNDFNPLQKLLVEHHGYTSWWVVPKHHLNYFDIESASRLLVSRDMAVIEREATYPLELFLLSGRNYVEHPELGRVCHSERKAFESALYRHKSDLIQKMFIDWAKQGIGREVVSISKKG